MVSFEAAVQPLLEAHDELSRKVGELEAELAELKEQRNRLRAAVKVLAPERLPESAQPKRKKPSGSSKFSTETGVRVLDFLTRSYNGSEFSGATALKHEDYDGPSQSTLSHVLHHLHETGSIRLVRRGRGGERFYEVIR